MAAEAAAPEELLPLCPLDAEAGLIDSALVVLFKPVVLDAILVMLDDAEVALLADTVLETAAELGAEVCSVGIEYVEGTMALVVVDETSVTVAEAALTEVPFTTIDVEAVSLAGEIELLLMLVVELGEAKVVEPVLTLVRLDRGAVPGTLPVGERMDKDREDEVIALGNTGDKVESADAADTAADVEPQRLLVIVVPLPVMVLVTLPGAVP